jgi:hypothetical protein
LLPLTAISDLETLHITDLVLHPSHDRDVPDLELSSVDFLDLEDLHDFEVVGQIIRFLANPFHISFIRCNFEDITDEFDYFADGGNGGVLTLEKINHDLVPLLRLWNGHELNIIDCPRFDDTLLDAMGSEEDGVFYCASYLEDLEITKAPNFSVAALRRFLESRLDLPVENDDPWNQVTPRVHSIRTFTDVPSMSRAEKAWFDANLTTHI